MPTDSTVCKLSQEIVVIKCRAVTIDCVAPGEPVAFVCSKGVAVPSVPERSEKPEHSRPADRHNEKRPDQHNHRRDNQPLHKSHAVFHRHRSKTPLDALFNLFRAPAGHH